MAYSALACSLLSVTGLPVAVGVAIVPNLPNLCAKAGKREPLQRKGVPNLPNLPNLSRVCTYPSAHPHPHAPACTCEQLSNIGWEGWEGWEEAVIERLLTSQPINAGWEGWEQRLGSSSGSRA